MSFHSNLILMKTEQLDSKLYKQVCPIPNGRTLSNMNDFELT